MACACGGNRSRVSTQTVNRAPSTPRSTGIPAPVSGSGTRQPQRRTIIRTR